MLVGKSQTLELHPMDAGYAFYKTLFQHTAGMRSHHGIVMITGIGIASQQANEHSRIFNSACEFSLCAHKGSARHGYGSANAIEKLFIRIANRVALLYNWFNEHTHKIGGAVRLKI